MIPKRDASEVVAGRERGEDAADRETEIDGGTETDEADHGIEQTAQETIEKTEVDPGKEKGCIRTHQMIVNNR